MAKRTSKIHKNSFLIALGFIVLLIALPLLILTTQQEQNNQSEASATSKIAAIYYPGWVQNSISPSSIDYSAWTHIMHFGMYPTTSGGVALADMQSASYPPAAVNAAHAAGKKIYLVIGGESQGAAFVAATKPAVLPTFVQNIVNTMKQYGYDGVDIDWEEQVNEAQLVELMRQLRVELDKISPRPGLTTAVISGLVSPATAYKMNPYTDHFNVMSYWSNGVDQFTAYNNAGIPASKIILGLGFSPGYQDLTASQVQAKINYVSQQGMAGVMAWQLGNLTTVSTDPRLAPIRTFLASSSTTATPTQQPVATSQPLTPPSNLRFTNITATSITMAWDAASGNVVSYTVTRGDAAFGNGVTAGTVPLTTLSFTDTAVSPSSSYGYCIRAVDVNGAVSESSNCLVANTPAVTNTPIPTATPTVIQSPTSTPIVKGGLTASYFTNSTLNTTTGLVRVDPTVDFNWGNGSPVIGIPKDNFSIRWKGYVIPRYSQKYTFYTQTDDGVRLWVNNVPLINDWATHRLKENRGTITLTAGQPYAITMEYFENKQRAVAKLLWSSPSQSKQIIPQSQLQPY